MLRFESPSQFAASLRRDSSEKSYARILRTGYPHDSKTRGAAITSREDPAIIRSSDLPAA